MTALTPIAAAEQPVDASLHDARGNHLRHDGWTPDRRRDFLANLADGHTVEDACRLVGKSVSSVYALRRRADGAAFALGWRAATLVARDHLADTMLARALHGVTDTWTRGDGTTVERHRHDNRLGTTLLRRLDNQADAATPGEAAAARLVAGDFDAFLALVAADAPAARAGLFLAARLEGDLAPLHALARADAFARAQAGTPTEVDTTDLDPAARATWTPDQWRRAEAAGLVALAPAPQDEALSPPLPPLEDAPPVWWDEELGDWRTSFPPPDGFEEDEAGMWGDEGYHRALTEAEAYVADAPRRRDRARRREAEAATRDAWFARIADTAATQRAPEPTPAADEPVEAPSAAAPTPTAAQAEPAEAPSSITPTDPARAEPAEARPERLAQAGSRSPLSFVIPQPIPVRHPGESWNRLHSTNPAGSEVAGPAGQGPLPPPHAALLGTPLPAAR